MQQAKRWSIDAARGAMRRKKWALKAEAGPLH
jgi:hypothetical protein